jgi:hypothetical protein
MSSRSLFNDCYAYKKKLQGIEERIKEKLEEYNDQKMIDFLFTLLEIAHIKQDDK